MENAVFHFVFYMGPGKGEAQAFHTARVSIGRASNCDFRLEAYQLDQVAPHHAELILEDENRFVLFDLGTKSGTYVNGERVHERCVLMTEDYVRFGLEGPEVIFRIGPALTGRQPLPQVFPVTAELQFFSGSDAGRIFPVNAAVTSNVGRRADLEVPLDPRGDMIVSGNHCNIRYVNGHFVLTDTSRNGTYVNGDLVDQPMEILDGDVIMLGDGGPQARFHVDAAGRNYPNHRPLSPVAASKDKTPPATSSFAEQAAARTGQDENADPKTQKEPPSAPAVLASAKPFSSGPVSKSAEIDPSAHAPDPPSANAELSPEAAAVNEEVLAAEAEHLPLKDAALERDKPAAEKTAAEKPGPGAAEAATALGSAAAGAAAAGALSASQAAGAAAAAGAAGAGASLVSGAASAADARPHKAAPDDADEIPDGRPDKTGRHSLSAVPKPVRTVKPSLAMLNLSAKKWAIVAVGFVLLVAIIIAVTGGGSDNDAGGPGGNYAAALKTTKTVENDTGKFSVEVPEDWKIYNTANGISMESPDKEVAVDYVRDGRISKDHVQNLLAKNGAQLTRAELEKIGDQEVEIRSSSVGNVRRISAISPAGGIPVLAMLETSEEALQKLSKSLIRDLLVNNVKVTGAPNAAAVNSTPPPPTPSAPSPAPTASTSLPQPVTPPADAATNNAEAPASEISAAPTPTRPDNATTASAPSNSAAQTASADAADAQADDLNTTPTGPSVKSQSLNLSLTAPTGWTATSEEADEMIMMAEGKGLVVRIARDPNDLDPDLTFKAMQEEGWKREGVKKAGEYFAGEFSNKEQHLLLILIPEKNKSTLLIYATSPDKFTQNQREAVVKILAQLLPQ